ncbi:MAG: helix-turn-helix domain-containing protein [Bacteroidota bacterium]
MQVIYDQLVYFAFFQSIFLLGIYTLSPSSRKNVNGYLAFLIFVLLIGLSSRVLYTLEAFEGNYRITAFSEYATLLFGPTVYLFTKSSLSDERFTYQNLLHYLPALFYITFLLFYYQLPDIEVINTRVISGELFQVVAILIGISLSVNITYWILSLQYFLKFKARLLSELSYTVKTQFFFNFLMAVGICLFAWTIIYFISILEIERLEIEARKFIWMSIAFIILFIAFYGIRAPELFKNKPLVVIQKYAQSKYSTTDLVNLKARLEAIMIEKQPYLNSKLLKAELAEMLGINNPELARLLNEQIGMNFFEFVNYYRIKAFIELAKTEKAQNMTLFGLAQEVGFNSKTTFTNAFKRLMGTTPSQYFKANS